MKCKNFYHYLLGCLQRLQATMWCQPDTASAHQLMLQKLALGSSGSEEPDTIFTMARRFDYQFRAMGNSNSDSDCDTQPWLTFARTHPAQPARLRPMSHRYREVLVGPARERTPDPTGDTRQRRSIRTPRHPGEASGTVIVKAESLEEHPAFKKNFWKGRAVHVNRYQCDWKFPGATLSVNVGINRPTHVFSLTCAGNGDTVVVNLSQPVLVEQISGSFTTMVLLLRVCETRGRSGLTQFSWLQIPRK